MHVLIYVSEREWSRNLNHRTLKATKNELHHSKLPTLM